MTTGVERGPSLDREGIRTDRAKWNLPVAALYEEAGATPPPTDEVLALYREGMTATLRELAAVAKGVELVGATCCADCRADNERTFKIADELPETSSLA
jgi:hypothetical protein